MRAGTAVHSWGNTRLGPRTAEPRCRGLSHGGHSRIEASLQETSGQQHVREGGGGLIRFGGE